MVVHRYHPTRDIDTLHQQYRIGDVRFLSGDDDGLIPLRQGVLRSNTFIQKDSLYSAADLQNTYSHFSRLGVVRYTNINFRERPDTNLLDCDYYRMLAGDMDAVNDFQGEYMTQYSWAEITVGQQKFE